MAKVTGVLDILHKESFYKQVFDYKRIYSNQMFSGFVLLALCLDKVYI